MTDEQIPVGVDRAGKDPIHELRLRRLVEIDHDVAAEDDVHSLPGRRIGEEVVHAELHARARFGAHLECPVVRGHEVGFQELRGDQAQGAVLVDAFRARPITVVLMSVPTISGSRTPAARAAWSATIRRV